MEKRPRHYSADIWKKIVEDLKSIPEPHRDTAFLHLCNTFHGERPKIEQRMRERRDA